MNEYRQLKSRLLSPNCWISMLTILLLSRRFVVIATIILITRKYINKKMTGRNRKTVAIVANSAIENVIFY